MQRRILSKKYVTLSEARELMKDRVSYQNIPLTPEQERAWEYLKLFGKLDPETARTAVTKLINEGLDPIVAVNLVNICPNSVGEVRSILSMKKEMVFTEELVSKILEILRDACSQTEARG